MQSRHPHPWFLMNILIYLLMYVRMVNSHLRDLGLTDPSLRWRGKTHKNPFKTETHVKGINILRLLISWVSPNRTFNSLVCVYSTSLVTILIIDHGLLIPSLMLVYRFPFFSSLWPSERTHRPQKIISWLPFTPRGHWEWMRLFHTKVHVP